MVAHTQKVVIISKDQWQQHKAVTLTIKKKKKTFITQAKIIISHTRSLSQEWCKMLNGGQHALEDTQRCSSAEGPAVEKSSSSHTSAPTMNKARRLAFNVKLVS